MELTNINDIKALLERNGFRFSKAMGQNFLCEAWVPERIAEEAGLDQDTGVLEIGPGVGCLTERLAERAGRVVCVELDRSLKPVLAETLARFDNVKIMFGDVIKLNISDIVNERLAGLRPVVCANLPYNITTPVLTRLIESGCFDSITVMVQREVARRMCATAGSADYGAFSLFIQWRCEAAPLFDVPPDCFIPQPKVTSTVLTLKTRKAPPADANGDSFNRIVRAAFNQRRKTLANALSSGLNELTKQQISEAIAAAGLDPRVRGEELSILQFAALTRILWPE